MRIKQKMRTEDENQTENQYENPSEQVQNENADGINTWDDLR